MGPGKHSTPAIRAGFYARGPLGLATEASLADRSELRMASRPYPEFQTRTHRGPQPSKEKANSLRQGIDHGHSGMAAPPRSRTLRVDVSRERLRRVRSTSASGSRRSSSRSEPRNDLAELWAAQGRLPGSAGIAGDLRRFPRGVSRSRARRREGPAWLFGMSVRSIAGACSPIPAVESARHGNVPCRSSCGHRPRSPSRAGALRSSTAPRSVR